MAQNFSEIANFLWPVADLLCGSYKQAGYGRATRLDRELRVLI